MDPIKKQSMDGLPTVEALHEIMNKGVYGPSFDENYAFNALMDYYVKHDINSFIEASKMFGEKKATELYNNIWAADARYDYKNLLNLTGIREPRTPEDFGRITVAYFEVYFTNPSEIVECDDEHCTVHIKRCPYSELARNYITLDNLKYARDPTQDGCNQAIAETFIKMSGQKDDIFFDFPTAICKGDEFCTWAFYKMK